MEKSYKLGKTIVGARGRDRSVELQRITERKKRRVRNVLIWCACVVVGVLVVIWAIAGIAGMVTERGNAATDETEWVPTVEIIIEGGGRASSRVNEFVAKLERDFGDLGFGVGRVILPQGRTREVHVYLVDRVEYYKMSIDRGCSVQAEDAERMSRYLDERGLVVQYVDLRVEGKAYYK
ncbi:hypothetical protein FWF89_03600 [Candidatus Saccharibacteria bacterium]|nr:hypothetical protein [Candidatus Saccharibacteria bacterium]